MWPSRRIIFRDQNQPRNENNNGLNPNFIDLNNFDEEQARRQLLRLLFMQQIFNDNPAGGPHFGNFGTQLSQAQIHSKYQRIVNNECEKLTLTAESKANDNLNQEECCICLDNLRIGTEVFLLKKCKHIFHEKCIDSWVKSKISEPFCPMCKQQLKEA